MTYKHHCLLGLAGLISETHIAKLMNVLECELCCTAELPLVKSFQEAENSLDHAADTNSQFAKL